MTVTLGWKSAVAAALLVVVAGLGIWLAVRNAKQRSVTDWERLQQIEQLGERLSMALKEIERLRKESDGYRQERDKSAEATSAAIAKYKALKSVQDKTPEQEAETCQACELALGLLETDLALADLEALSLRRERAALIAASRWRAVVVGSDVTPRGSDQAASSIRFARSRPNVGGGSGFPSSR